MMKAFFSISFLIFIFGCNSSSEEIKLAQIDFPVSALNKSCDALQVNNVDIVSDLPIDENNVDTLLKFNSMLRLYSTVCYSNFKSSYVEKDFIGSRYQVWQSKIDIDGKSKGADFHLMSIENKERKKSLQNLIRNNLDCLQGAYKTIYFYIPMYCEDGLYIFLQLRKEDFSLEERLSLEKNCYNCNI